MVLEGHVSPGSAQKGRVQKRKVSLDLHEHFLSALSKVSLRDMDRCLFGFFLFLTKLPLLKPRKRG